MLGGGDSDANISKWEWTWYIKGEASRPARLEQVGKGECGRRWGRLRGQGQIPEAMLRDAGDPFLLHQGPLRRGMRASGEAICRLRPESRQGQWWLRPGWQLTRGEQRLNTQLGLKMEAPGPADLSQQNAQSRCTPGATSPSGWFLSLGELMRESGTRVTGQQIMPGVLPPREQTISGPGQGGSIGWRQKQVHWQGTWLSLGTNVSWKAASFWSGVGWPSRAGWKPAAPPPKTSPPAHLAQSQHRRWAAKSVKAHSSGPRSLTAGFRWRGAPTTQTERACAETGLSLHKEKRKCKWVRGHLVQTQSSCRAAGTWYRTRPPHSTPGLAADCDGARHESAPAAH